METRARKLIDGLDRIRAARDSRNLARRAVAQRRRELPGDRSRAEDAPSNGFCFKHIQTAVLGDRRYYPVLSVATQADSVNPRHRLAGSSDVPKLTLDRG